MVATSRHEKICPTTDIARVAYYRVEHGLSRYQKGEKETESKQQTVTRLECCQKLLRGSNDPMDVP